MMHCLRELRGCLQIAERALDGWPIGITSTVLQARIARLADRLAELATDCMMVTLPE